MALSPINVRLAVISITEITLIALVAIPSAAAVGVMKSDLNAAVSA